MCPMSEMVTEGTNLVTIDSLFEMDAHDASASWIDTVYHDNKTDVHNASASHMTLCTMIKPS